VELQRLNLNLVVHLDALLAQRSVSGAAEQLGLSQPSVSSALARLRRHFGDELLTRQGNRYDLTPLALRLRPLVADAISGTERVFMSQQRFDPASAEREFVLLTSDYWLDAVGPSVSRLLAERAPGCTLRVQDLHSADLDDPVETMRTVDGFLLPHGLIREAPHVDLVRTRWRAIVDADNPRVGERLDLQTLAELPWVIYGSRGLRTSHLMHSIVVRQLRLAGLDPRIEATVSTFTSVPAYVRGTDRVAVVHHSTALRAQEQLGLRVLRLPIADQEVTLAFWWHQQQAHEGAHRWFRDLLVDAAGPVVETVPGFSTLT
jgi:DNA-binding transcriptional LysR family regulator